MRQTFSKLFCLIAVLTSPVVLADWLDLPVSDNNNGNPFVQIHGLQGFSGVEILSLGEKSSRIVLQTHNEFYQKQIDNEFAKLDYERTTLSMSFSYGLNERLSVGVEIPYMINSGGYLDGLIENWHDLFGFNQGGRDNAQRDEFFIAYSNRGAELLLDKTDQGLGDISLFADRSIGGSARQEFKLRAKLKLPSGDEDNLFGSGGFALSLHINAAAKVSENLFAYGGVGISYLADGDVLADQQNNLVAVATFGLGWQLRPRLMLSAQLDLNSNVYDDSDLDAISGQAGVLFVSAQYKFSNKTSLQLGFTEDVINKDGASDFGIRIGYNF